MILGVNLSHDYALCVLDGEDLRLEERERTSRIRYHGIGYDTLELLDAWSDDELRRVTAIFLCSPFMNRMTANGATPMAPTALSNTGSQASSDSSLNFFTASRSPCCCERLRPQ